MLQSVDIQNSEPVTNKDGFEYWNLPEICLKCPHRSDDYCGKYDMDIWIAGRHMNGCDLTVRRERFDVQEEKNRPDNRALYA